MTDESVSSDFLSETNYNKEIGYPRHGHLNRVRHPFTDGEIEEIQERWNHHLATEKCLPVFSDVHKWVRNEAIACRGRLPQSVYYKIKRIFSDKGTVTRPKVKGVRICKQFSPEEIREIQNRWGYLSTGDWIPPSFSQVQDWIQKEAQACKSRSTAAIYYRLNKMASQVYMNPNLSSFKQGNFDREKIKNFEDLWNINLKSTACLSTGTTRSQVYSSVVPSTSRQEFSSSEITELLNNWDYLTFSEIAPSFQQVDDWLTYKAVACAGRSPQTIYTKINEMFFNKKFQSNGDNSQNDSEEKPDCANDVGSSTSSKNQSKIIYDSWNRVRNSFSTDELRELRLKWGYLSSGKCKTPTFSQVQKWLSTEAVFCKHRTNQAIHARIKRTFCVSNTEEGKSEKQKIKLENSESDTDESSEDDSKTKKSQSKKRKGKKIGNKRKISRNQFSEFEMVEFDKRWNKCETLPTRGQIQEWLENESVACKARAVETIFAKIKSSRLVE